MSKSQSAVCNVTEFDPSLRQGKTTKPRNRRRRNWPPRVATLNEDDYIIAAPANGGPQVEPAKSAPKAAAARSAPDTSEAIALPPPERLETGQELNLDDAEVDPELIQLLERLSTTIDTAHNVLREAAIATRAQIEESEAKQETLQDGVEDGVNVGTDAGRSVEDATPPDRTTLPDEGREQPRSDEYADVDGEQKVLTRPILRPRRGGSALRLTATILAVGAIPGAAWLGYSQPTLLGVDPMQWLEAAIERPDQPKRSFTMMRIPEVSNASLSLPGAPATPQPTQAKLTTPSETTPEPSEPLLLPAGKEPKQLLVPKQKTEPTTPPGAQPNDGTLRGAAEQAIPLGLKLPEKSQGAEMTAMIQGVPNEVTLSAGRRVGQGTWIVDASEIESLSLIAPAQLAGKNFSIDVTLVKSDGKIPEARSLALAVDTAPQPKPQTPIKPDNKQTAPASTPQVRAEPKPNGPQPTLPAQTLSDLIRRAEEMAQQGDIAAARLLYEHAARHGSVPAMRALAQTFEPEFLAKLGVRGVRADKTQATAWYERAAREGDR